MARLRVSTPALAMPSRFVLLLLRILCVRLPRYLLDFVAQHQCAGVADSYVAGRSDWRCKVCQCLSQSNDPPPLFGGSSI